MVSRKTGLSPQLIRAWEKRYEAVKPRRNASNRRLYDEAEVERLALMRTLTRCGHSIGLIAKLPDSNLRELLARETAPEFGSKLLESTQPTSPEFFISAALHAIEQMDSDALDAVLNRSLLALGMSGALQRVYARIIEKVGDRWQDGTLKIAHEHFATAMFRVFLGECIRTHRQPADAPLLVVTTPAEQHHELGALLIAAAAHQQGWRTAYLGPSLPAEEIASTATTKQARAIALSIVYPKDDPMMERELARLRKLLPAGTAIIAGGRAADAYRSALERVGARVMHSQSDFYEFLDQLRNPAAPNNATQGTATQTSGEESIS